jgi:glucose/arabinose dehydrogenase
MLKSTALCLLAALLLASASCSSSPSSAPSPSAAVDDPRPFMGYKGEHPGKVHHIRAEDLPPPFATGSAGNPPILVDRPSGVLPKAPPGFSVSIYADGFDMCRVLRTAPDGSVFVAESGAGRIDVLRGFDGRGHARSSTVFASGLNRPYGIAFHPPGLHPRYVYVGETGSVVRFPYPNGGKAEHVADLPAGGGHWTRDLAFSPDGKKLFVAVGSVSNDDDPETHPGERHRADVLVLDAENPGGAPRVYASGLRNPAGLAVSPKTGQLWVTVNERDGLGDNLVPDFITHVEEGAFYGWPYSYIGSHPDPHHKGEHADLVAKAKVPDVLVQAHDASLQIVFYEGSQFPSAYRSDVLASEHGSWNRQVPTGYEVIRVRMDPSGHATGAYEDFLTGFILDDGRVWGRPVGVTVAEDGSLLVSDDGSNTIWRVKYTGSKG